MGGSGFWWQLSRLAVSLGAGLIGWIQAGAGAVARTVLDKLRERVTPGDFGAVGDGAADDTAALQQQFTNKAAGAGKIEVSQVAPGKNIFKISAVVNLVNAAYTWLDFEGVKVAPAHDGIAFDLTPATNPANPNSTLVPFIRTVGGQIVNQAGTHAASIAFRAHGAKEVVFRDQWIEGFNVGHSVPVTDTLRIEDVHYFNNDVDIDFPHWDVHNPVVGTMDAKLIGVHHSVSGKISAVRSRTFVSNFYVEGGSCNGPTTGPGYDFEDYNTAAAPLPCFEWRGHHFEQGTTQPYISLRAPNGNGYSVVKIGGASLMSGSANNFVAIWLEKCAHVVIDAGFFGQAAFAVTGNGASVGVSVVNGSAVLTFAGATQIGVLGTLFAGQYIIAPGVPLGRKIQSFNLGANQLTMDGNADGSFPFTSATFNIATVAVLDANCSDIEIGENRVSGVPPQIVYLCARKELRFLPEIRVFDAVVALTGFDGASHSTTAATTLDMRVLLGANWPSLGTPKAYAINVVANDSGCNAAADGACEVQVFTPGDTVARCLKGNMAGLKNDAHYEWSATVDADKYGNLAWSCIATGANTLDLRIAVAEIHM